MRFRGRYSSRFIQSHEFSSLPPYLFFLNVCSFALFFLLHKRARVNAQNLLARVRREEEEEIRDVQRVFVVLFVGRSNASCRDVSVFLL
jgi:hypothetical protein